MIKETAKESNVSDKVDQGVKDSDDEFKKLEKLNLSLIKKFKEENQDVVGIIEIPGTALKYPILHTVDNDYYLTRGLNEKYDIAGSIFMDTNNDPDLNDDNSVIYGHHMQLESMFSPLDKYREQDFAQSHRTLYITTEEGLREYEIFSAYGIDAEYDYRTLDFMYDEDKVPYFDKLKNNSEVILETREFTKDDSIVTLSTCQYDYDDQRLAVHALRIR